MDLEAQSLLLDGEDSVDVRPQRRTLPRAAFFVVAAPTSALALGNLRNLYH
ncbi:unnamed protein product [Cladocopium goreaui]|uniref:Uncharacterized protein n=1 Tax=Cladocopium goreaui TaxID=2562237 RepID=A0A9P1CF92_9DINO|nr:unnamed protein product [Cladocopium goreaui]